MPVKPVNPKIRIKTLEQQITALNSIVSTLNDQIKAYVSERDRLTSELTLCKSERELITKRLSELEQELAEATAAIPSLETISDHALIAAWAELKRLEVAIWESMGAISLLLGDQRGIPFNQVSEEDIYAVRKRFVDMFSKTNSGERPNVSL